MYEQYTDEQIVEMLLPKMNKCSNHTKWDGLIEKPWGNADLFKVIATIYRSAYIRGQLGRSFIIGEPKRTKPKQTEHWVPATKTNLKPGVKVRYLNAEKHKQNPEFYPAQSTIGEVVSIGSIDDDDTCPVQWPGYITYWYASRFDLEVLLCE